MNGAMNRLSRGLLTARMPLIFGVLVAAAAMFVPHFWSANNIVSVLQQVSFEAIIAFGMTAVIITGGIDLSVGSLVALTGVAAGLAMQGFGVDASPWLAVGIGAVVGMACGAGVGAVSGSVVAWLAIPPFIVTLAAMLVARGAAFILCDGKPIYELPPELRLLGRGFVLEGSIGRVLPVPVVIMLAAYGVFAFMLSRTVFGRSVVSIGSNEEASRLAGIPVRWTKMLVYVITGAVSGLVGVLVTAELAAADPKVGDMWELNVIAAVVVGGTSLFGGRGSMTGTLVGALIIGVLNNSLNLLHVEHFWQKVVLGSVILAAAIADAGLRRLNGRAA